MGKCGNDAPIIIEGKKGDPGERGLPGEKGESITLVGSSITAEGDTQVNLSDGSSFIVKKGIDGTNGLNGMDGKSITLAGTETDSLGNTVVSLSDGSSFTVLKGDKGDRGANGDRGQDGASITIRSTSIADNGDVELHFSDGTVVPIPKGERGANGRDGVDGHDKVQVSATEPTDPNISLWIKPDGENCCAVSCAELDTRLEDYYRKHAVDTKIDENNKKVFKHHKVFADLKDVSGSTGGTSFSTVPFQQISTNFGGFELDNGVVTIPETGIYLINASVRIADFSKPTEFGIGVHTNNTDGYWFTWHTSVEARRHQYTYSRIVNLNKGDKIRLYVYDQAGQHPYYRRSQDGEINNSNDVDSWGTNMQIALLYPESEVQ